MASTATPNSPGRVARVIHWLFPSRQQVAIDLAATLGLTVLGLPAWMHVALSVTVHTTIHLLGKHPK